jgi:hypothetical protein
MQALIMGANGTPYGHGAYLFDIYLGNATENWDPKVSTLLQVLVSIQAIIMSEDVYFNEPGFEN